ncbi:sensor histidine kinase [Roseovarius mucosus]|uniref:histidine kinase n=1 Tax=Roseovarius mucosus TaxID=215743 RepID=A0A1V0RRD1_9RHOB|nr:hypothetical protein [Roseovarius mucosus]ARE84323.1 sensor histidine kinase LiaS [Roseovarius mucosus]
MSFRTMVNTTDILSSQGFPAKIWQFLRHIWSGLSLLTQFMILVAVTVLFISAISNKAIKQIAATSLIESSLEVEQAMARSLVLPVLGQQPLVGDLENEVETMLRNVVTRHLNPRYINKIKLWGVDGRLLFDSDQEYVAADTLDPTVQRVLEGETVIVSNDTELHENITNNVSGDLVYEVYMPLLSLDGKLIAVLEAYCSSDLLASRIQATLKKIDQMRFGVLFLGMLLLAALVFYAQKHIQRQENQLLASMRATENLAQRNRELLKQSEDIRRRSSEANEHLLNHIGAELHDGPIQLLSIAALYRGQADIERLDNPLQEKAQHLFQKALQELRNISIGLILPELEDASLCEAVCKAVEAVKQDWDMTIELEISPTDCHLPLPQLVVAYRVVYEALNNAWKHGTSSASKVTLSISSRQFDIKVFNLVTPSACQVANEAPEIRKFPHYSVGMIGMQKRVQGIGGILRVVETDGGVLVHVTAPILEPDALEIDLGGT